MLNIKIVCVGSHKEKFYKEAELEFLKRLSRYAKIEVIECREYSHLNEKQKIDVETKEIESHIKGEAILLAIDGSLITSENLAKTLNDVALKTSNLTFIIGGSNGVNEQILNNIKQKISFGRITLPHNLARIVLLEQIYRAFTINNNLPYHK